MEGVSFLLFECAMNVEEEEEKKKVRFCLDWKGSGERRCDFEWRGRERGVKERREEVVIFGEGYFWLVTVLK
jgi:hypothetical protein